MHNNGEILKQMAEQDKGENALNNNHNNGNKQGDSNIGKNNTNAYVEKQDQKNMKSGGKSKTDKKGEKCNIF